MDVGLVCDACSALTPIGVPQCARCGQPVALDPRPRRRSAQPPNEPASNNGALKNYSIEIFGNQGRSPEQINLMNLHNSKGLEFETVFIVGLEKGVFPSERDDTPEKVEEKKRLFYVGITRAKTSVHLMYGFNESPLISIVREGTRY